MYIELIQIGQHVFVGITTGGDVAHTCALLKLAKLMNGRLSGVLSKKLSMIDAGDGYNRIRHQTHEDHPGMTYRDTFAVHRFK